jgi:hypothetical protein
LFDARLRGANQQIATAVPELLYPGAAAFEWHFPQENATFYRAQEGK